MAAALLNALHDPNCSAASAGLHAYPGDAISHGSLEALRFTGTPIDTRAPYPNHLSRQISKEDLQNADLVVGITNQHADILRTHFPQYRDKITVFPDEIPDPYGCDLSVYLSTLASIRNGVSELYRTVTARSEGILPLIKNDVASIYHIERNSFTTPWSEESFLVSMENPVTHGIVKIEKGTLTGYAIFSVLFEEAELYNIAVDAQNREKGVGSELLQAVIAHCKTYNAQTLRLEVRQSNIAAQKLYEKFGFEYESKRKNYYQNPVEDALLMYLSLNNTQKESL